MSSAQEQPPAATLTTPAAAPAFKIDLNYLAPTLSAILAGIIHHVCNKKEQLAYTDLLLILSPSMPVICQLILKIITWFINAIIGLFGYSAMVAPFGSYMAYLFASTASLKKERGLCEDNITPIFEKYSTTKTPAEKMVEWQEMGYYVKVYYGMNMPVVIDSIIYNITQINSQKYDHFYHEFQVNGEYFALYKNNIFAYIASSCKKYTENITLVMRILFPPEYTENTSKFRISRIYNQYSSEIMQTIQKFKSVKDRHVNINFLFSGKPGTCKTYAARAIAAELGRRIVEVDLKTITYEDEFMAIFEKDSPTTSVYLFDEIDLMCPSREYDDLIVKQMETARLQKCGPLSASSAASVYSISDEEKSIGELDSRLLQNMCDKLHDMCDKVHELNEKVDGIFSFQSWLKKAVQFLIKLYLSMHIPPSTYCESANKSKYIELLSPVTNLSGSGVAGTNTTKYILDNPWLLENTENDGHMGTNQHPIINISKPIRQPFTLRTLLNFISGGSTPDDLCIVATTNRPEMLDPALTRPGRLRHMEFEYLRVDDAVNIIHDAFPDISKECINEKLIEIEYYDKKGSGALLAAIISSTNTVNQCIQVLQRELCKGACCPL